MGCLWEGDFTGTRIQPPTPKYFQKGEAGGIDRDTECINGIKGINRDTQAYQGYRA